MDSKTFKEILRDRAHVLNLRSLSRSVSKAYDIVCNHPDYGMATAEAGGLMVGSCAIAMLFRDAGVEMKEEDFLWVPKLNRKKYMKEFIEKKNKDRPGPEVMKVRGHRD